MFVLHTCMHCLYAGKEQGCSEGDSSQMCVYVWWGWHGEWEL